MQQHPTIMQPTEPSVGTPTAQRRIMDAAGAVLNAARSFIYQSAPTVQDPATRQAAAARPLPADMPLAVALSGGADSTALLMALVAMGCHVEALHCNFELRGRESDADEAACRRLCRRYGVPLTVRHFRTRAFAQRQGMSIEMAARELRYEWFADVVRQRGLAALCVAHHRDDNIETMLLNLIRGTGLRGLTGMKPVTRRKDGLVVVRPLLGVTRADIESWLTAEGASWQTDSTNLSSDAAQRNTIRLELLPLLETMNPRVRETLAATAQRLNDAQLLCDDAMTHVRHKVSGRDATHAMTIDIDALRQTAAPSLVLYELLSPAGFTGDQVTDIMSHLDGDPGHVWLAKGGARLLRDRGRLLLDAERLSTDVDTRRSATAEATVMPLDGRIELSGVCLNVRRRPVDATFVIPRQATVACFDLSRLTLPLTLRRTRMGDRFRPFGMEGTRLVSDLLTDAKVSLFERERQLVVCSGDEIIWVVGRRVAAGHEVTADTRHAMTITLEG